MQRWAGVHVSATAINMKRQHEWGGAGNDCACSTSSEEYAPTAIGMEPFFFGGGVGSGLVRRSHALNKAHKKRPRNQSSEPNSCPTIAPRYASGSGHCM